MYVLHYTVASDDATDKLKVELTNSACPEGVAHDERSVSLSKLFKFGILLPSIIDNSRREVIVHCIQFGVEQDKRHDPLVQTAI